MNNAVYNDLWVDSFLSALFLPIQDEFVLATMSSFGEYDTLTMFFLALFASISAYGINWYVGKLIMHEPWVSANLRAGYDRACLFANNYGKWLLLLVWVDVYGTFLPLIAGMFRIKLKWALFIAALGKGAYYIYAFNTGNFTVQA